MKYGYLVAYMYSRGSNILNFDLFGGGMSYAIANASLNCAKKVEDWTDKDFKDFREKLAKSLSNEIEDYNGKKIEVKYKADDIVILNMIRKKMESEVENHDEKDGKDNGGNYN